MRCLEVVLNGALLCRAGIENALMYSLDLGVSLDGESPAYVSVSGMHELPDGEKIRVRWADFYPLASGDHLALTLVESKQPTPVAETNDADTSDPDWQDDSEVSCGDAQEATASPWKNIQVRCAVNGALKAEAEISSGEAHLTGSLRWNQWHPDRCRVSVHSCLQAGAPETDWLKADLAINDCLEFQIQSA